ncbi:LytR/AlgR family response regulator transcription factor [Parapedobacter tibetensis]|uniref:LytR/AlgR family response regulator transcription factor n=1 Tax=Parapedobacter tibetensis TaxID=2972951 RepID=UPI00214D96DF|nr:LytTR family DNA-binding domain-containing protein [Parapedobacter tibetensis]
MTKALLIDDEERATDSLRLMIEKFIPEIDQVWSCNDARKGAQLIHKICPDLVFLDIRMPHLSGFDLLNAIPNKRFKVIFTTAYDEYAIKSIRFSAFDYLLKPIDAEELISAVKRYFQSSDDWSQQPALFKNITHNMHLQARDEFRLALPSKEGIHFLMPHEIIRCEAASNYTTFYIDGGKQHITSKTLGEYDELLSPYHFIRTHKSHLVNRDFISFIDHDGFIVLKDATKVEISRRRKGDVMAALSSPSSN